MLLHLKDGRVVQVQSRFDVSWGGMRHARLTFVSGIVYDRMEAGMLDGPGELAVPVTAKNFDPCFCRRLAWRYCPTANMTHMGGTKRAMSIQRTLEMKAWSEVDLLVVISL